MEKDVGSDLHAPVAVLVASLEIAFSTPETRPDDRAVTLRNGYIEALTHIGRFLATIGQKKIARRFFELQYMLQDLEKGIVHPVFLQGQQRGRQVRFDIWFVRLNVANAIELLTQSGMEAKDAAQYAAKNFPALARLIRDARDTLASAILSWHRILKDGAVSNENIHEMSEESQVFLNELIPRLESSTEELRKVADDMLERASHEARRSILTGE